MTSAPTPPQASDSLRDLAERCRDLADKACTQLDSIASDSESFLIGSLTDSLQQLEIVMRLVDEEVDGIERKDERRSLLRRLLKRGDDEEGDELRQAAENYYLPDFDVTQQGLQGNSLTIPLSELVGFLSYCNKTGVLWVDGAEENILLGLMQGKLMHATSDRTPEGLRIGEILVGLGYLTRRQLERFLEKHVGPDDIVTGEQLLDTGLISEEELQEALAQQVTQLFDRLINMRHAVFRFREGVEVPLAYQVDLDINQLLLHTARLKDEASNSGLRATAEADAWQAWQTELYSTIGSIAFEQQGQRNEDVEEEDDEASMEVDSENIDSAEVDEDESEDDGTNVFELDEDEDLDVNDDSVENMDANDAESESDDESEEDDTEAA